MQRHYTPEELQFLLNADRRDEINRQTKIRNGTPLTVEELALIEETVKNRDVERSNLYRNGNGNGNGQIQGPQIDVNAVLQELSNGSS